MNENLPTNVQLDANGNGTVSFATDVVATIAGLAATEVEGVASMYGGSTGLADIFTRRGQSARSLTKGVRVELNESAVSVHLTIVVEYGSPVPEVAQNIQENVKKAIETMSGLEVTSVDVHVQGVSFERENRAAAEIEMQQRLMLQRQQEEHAEEEAAAQAEETEEAVAQEESAEAEEDTVPAEEAPAQETAEEPAEENETAEEADVCQEEASCEEAPAEEAPAEEAAQEEETEETV